MKWCGIRGVLSYGRIFARPTAGERAARRLWRRMRTPIRECLELTRAFNEVEGSRSRLRTRSGLALTATGSHSLPTRSTPSIVQKSKSITPPVGGVMLLLGGAEGSRTPVRKPLDITFFGCSRLIIIPLGSAQETRRSFG